MTSKLNEILVKFSKLKLKKFINAPCQYLFVAIFHINCCEFISKIAYLYTI